MSRLLFCCDATPTSGLGHFARCHDLALALRADRLPFEVTFFGNYAEHARDALARSRFAMFPAGADTFSVQTLRQRLTEGDAVVVDSYVAEPPFYDFLNERGTPWVAFDDLGRLDFAGAALVINFRIHAERLFGYRAARAALGPHFMPIHPDLMQLRRRREGLPQNARPEHVVVFVGGNDLYAMSRALGDLAAELLPGARVSLIVNDPAAVRPRSNSVVCLPLQPSLAPLLEHADLLISGGGRLKYEAGFVLVPNAALSQTPLQAADTKILAAAGLTLDLGDAGAFDEARARSGLVALVDAEARTAMVERQRATFPDHDNRPLLTLLRTALVAVPRT